MRSGAIAGRALAGIIVVLLGCCPTAAATAGAPDPSFGSRGVVELPQHSSASAETKTGNALVLPEGGVLVPEFRTEYRTRRGSPIAVNRMTMRLISLRPDGSTERVSAWIVLPNNLGDPRIVRTADGTLLVIGIRYKETFKAVSLYALRLSADGIPATAPGGSAPAMTVQLSSIPHLGSTTERTAVDAVSIAPSGRVFLVFRRSHVYSTNEREVTGYGPIVVAAIDPSIGLVSGFAGGALVIAPATDTRTSAAAAVTVDETGHLLVLVRSTRNGIGGTAQYARLTRYDTAGIRDDTFADGQVDIDLGDIDTAYEGSPSIAVLRGGDVLTRLDATTDSGGSTVSSIQLRRFLPTGQPAAEFGSAGTANIVLQRSKSSHFGPSSSYGFRSDEPPALLEQPDGKLVIATDRIPIASWMVASRDGILRTTAAGALDTTYAKDGFARFDAPWSGGVAGTPVGLDADGRVFASISTRSDAGTRHGVVRLLAGDEPAPATSARLRIDGRICGVTRARACFDPDGAVEIAGQVLAAGQGVAGASVVLNISRPSSTTDADIAPELPAVRTNADGRFSVRLAKGKALPGTWQVTARVIATTSSQRLDSTRPVYFTLGPRADISMLRLVHRSQALAVAIDYVVSDSIDYDQSDEPANQCTTPATCFRPSAQLRSLVSATAHPTLGKAGLLVRKSGHYTIVTRAPTNAFRLEFIITQTPAETSYSCRGDAAARKRWCPNGTWDDVFDDAFVTAGVDGAPFDW